MPGFSSILLNPTLLGATALAGAVLAWSLAAPPGPINALIAHAAARRGFWAGWVYGLGAIAGDMTMFVLTGIGVVAIVDRLPWLKVGLSFVGAGLLLWFAIGAWRTARGGARLGSDDEDRALPASREFVKAYAIVITSPYNWAWWLTAGASMLSLLGWATAFGFFGGLLAWTVFWAALARAGATRIRRLAEFVAYGAAIVLVLFSGITLWYGVTSAAALLG